MDINEHLQRKLNQGPLKASIRGGDRLVVSVEFPSDEQGFTERSCSAVDCEPKLFKVRGALPDAGSRSCPYCGHQGDGNSFATDDQVRYAREKVSREAKEAIGDAVHQMMRDALGMDLRGRRRIGSGPFSMDMSMTRRADRQPDVALPRMERPRRDVKCGACGLDHIVFGLATWCHACGKDIFDAHVGAELRDITALLRDGVGRRQEMSERLFARQAENALEDLVSAWEAGLRYTLQRRLLSQGKTRAETDSFIQKTIRNQFQSLERSAELVKEHLHVEVFANVDANDLATAIRLFAARHAITHCLGVIDPKFVSKAGAGHVGREVEVDPAQLEWLAAFIESRLLEVWAKASPAAGQTNKEEGSHDDAP